MRNNLDIIPNPALKGLSYKIPQLASASPNSIIKLAQGKNIIYFKYDHHENQSMLSNNNNAIELPQKLCQFNNIVKGAAHYEQVFNIKQCKRVSLFVSKLDWQIVNNKAQMLEQQVMNQINIVWPKAVFPLYYDRNNYVKIRVSCQSIGILADNSQLQILVDQDEEKKKDESGQYEINCIKILPVVDTPDGNINKIYLRKNHPIFIENLKSIKINFDKKGRDESQLKSIKQEQDLNENNIFWLQFQKMQNNCTVPSDTNILSIKQQVNLIKSMKQNKQKKKRLSKNQIQRIQVQVIVIDESPLFEHWKNIQPVSLASDNQNGDDKQKDQLEVEEEAVVGQDKKGMIRRRSNCIMMGQSTIKYWNISTQNTLKIKKKNKSQAESKTLGYLLKMKQINIRIGISEQKEENQQKMVNYFIYSLIQQLKINRKMRVYHKFPYLINTFKTDSKDSHNSSQFAFIQFRNKEQILSESLQIVYGQALKKQSKINERKEQKISQSEKKQEVQEQPENKRNQYKQLQLQQHPNKRIEVCKKSEEESNILKKIKQITKVNNYFYSNQNLNQVKMKAMALNSLNKSIIIAQKEFSHEGLGHIKEEHNTFEYLHRKCYSAQIEKVLGLVQNYLKMVKQKGYSFYLQPILITSFANNGKTVFNSIIVSNRHQTLYIDLSQMDDTSHNLADLNEFLQISFQLSKASIIFMDNLDSVCYKIDKGDAHRRQQRIASKLILRKIMTLSQTYRKLCIFTAKNQGNIDEQLIHYELIRLKNPNRETRQKILIQYSSENGNKYTFPQIQQMVQASESMSFGQFSKYVIKGHKDQINQSSISLNFNKLAGIHQIKKILRSVVERPLKYSFVFKKLPIKLSRGVLLYGGSGTGKSAIGQALAGQFKMKYFNVKGSDILSKYIGGSEAAVRDIFQKAMSVSPSIIFFDEFQSIVPRRNSSNTGVTDRVVNQFLCYLDGVASIEGVYIIAASSRPQLIDPALLRPGRIDTHIFLDLPTRQERLQLLGLYRKSIEFETCQQQILDITDGYSYSDLIGLIKELRIKKSGKIIQNYKEDNKKIESKEFKTIEDQFLKEILRGFRVPTTKQERMKERQRYLAFQRGDAPDISKQKSMLK